MNTIELRPEQWWHLIRVLLSLDHWMNFLAEALAAFTREVRRVVEPGSTESRPLLTVDRHGELR